MITPEAGRDCIHKPEWHDQCEGENLQELAPDFKAKGFFSKLKETNQVQALAVFKITV